MIKATGSTSLSKWPLYRNGFLTIAVSSECNRRIRNKEFQLGRKDKSKASSKVFARLALKHTSTRETNWALPRVVTWVSTNFSEDQDSKDDQKTQPDPQEEVELNDQDGAKSAQEKRETNEQKVPNEEKAGAQMFLYGPPPIPDENDPQVLDQAYLPLLRRGWIFQERLLSPRMVYIGPDELIWECSDTSQCQCSTKEWSRERQEKDKLGKQQLSPLLLGEEPENTPE
jgi:hypothetical protein